MKKVFSRTFYKCFLTYMMYTDLPSNSRFTILVNDDLGVYLSSKEVRLEEFFVIMCFGQGYIPLLQKFLRGKNEDQIIAYLQPLIRKSLLVKNDIDVVSLDWSNYLLTDKSEQILRDCVINIEGNLKVSSDVVEKIEVDSKTQEIVELVTNYIELFPEKVKNGGGEYLRSNKLDVAKKMRVFLKKYKYTNEQVLEATRRYVKRNASKGYLYCSSASYFISKNGDSKLATECDSLIQSEGESTENSPWDKLM